MEEKITESLNLTVEEAKEKLGKKYIEINRHPGERLFVESISSDGSMSCSVISADPAHEGHGCFHVDVKEITKIGRLETKDLWKK